jgi:hypothetical protein
MSLSEREKMVITLLKQKVPPKKVADQLGMSLRDVYRIKREEFGKDKAELTNELEALMLYSTGKKPVQVAITLRIPSDEAMLYCIKYNNLIHGGEFGNAYQMVKERGQLKELLDICEAMKIERFTVKDMVNASQMSGDLAEMEDRFLVVARDTKFYEDKENTVLRELGQAETKLARINSNIQAANVELARINSNIQAANVELARIMNSYQVYYNQNNTTYPNYTYPNYYNSNNKWGANVKYY